MSVDLNTLLGYLSALPSPDANDNYGEVPSVDAVENSIGVALASSVKLHIQTPRGYVVADGRPNLITKACPVVLYHQARPGMILNRWESAETAAKAMISMFGKRAMVVALERAKVYSE